jgi:hypothetical protein
MYLSNLSPFKNIIVGREKWFMPILPGMIKRIMVLLQPRKKLGIFNPSCTGDVSIRTTVQAGPEKTMRPYLKSN